MRIRNVPVLMLSALALVLPVASGAGAAPPPGHGKPDPCDKKKPKVECPPPNPEPQRPYITTVAGGGYTDGRSATEANLATPSDVAIDAAGNVYVGDGSEGRIRMIDTNGVISTFAGNGIRGYRGDGGPATQARLASAESLTFGPDGALYFVDGRYGVIRKVDTSGIITTVAGSTEQPLHAAAIEFGPDGALYIVIDDVIERFEADGTRTRVAGTGTRGFSGDGGPAVQAELNFPGDIDFAPDGSLYVADTANRVVRRIDASGVITTVAGDGEYASRGDGGPATEASFMLPTHLTVGPDGSLIVSDGPAQRMRRVDPAGVIETVVGTGATGFSGDGGPATLAEISAPFGSAFDAAGNLYFVDAGNDRIRRIDTTGIVTTFAGNGQEWHLGDGEDATSAALRLPGGAVQGPDGTLYIADTGHQRIRRVDPVTNVMTTYAGTGKLGFSGDGGQAAAAKLADPWDVDVDDDGNLYVADYWNNRIRKITPGGVITTIAGTGVPGHSGDGGPAIAATMDHPTAVDFHDGEVFVAVGGSKAIRVIDRNGIITTLAGRGYLPAEDGAPAALVGLSGPTDVVALDDGRVLFADAFGHRVWAIDSSGLFPVLDLVAGSGTQGFSPDGVAAIEADLAFPWSVLPLRDGSLLVSDHNNHRVRRISPDGVLSTYAGDGRDELAGDGGNPLAASFRGPTNLTLARDGVLVTDSANGRLRVVRE